MKRFARNLVLSTAVAATALAAIPARADRLDPKTEAMIGAGFLGLAVGVAVGALAAEADARAQDRNPRPRPHQDRNFFPDAPGHAGQPGYNVYEADGPRYGDRYQRPGRYERNDRYDRYDRYDRNNRYDRGGGYERGGSRNNQARGYEAWSPEWARWCRNRYRSFNINTGTFTTNGGEQRFCVVQ